MGHAQERAIGGILGEDVGTQQIKLSMNIFA